MISFKELYSSVKTKDEDEDALIERLMENERIKKFVLSNDLSTRIILNNAPIFLTYENDEIIDANGNVKSKLYPDYSPILNYQNGVVSISYKIKTIKKTEMFTYHIPEDISKAQLSDVSRSGSDRLAVSSFINIFLNSYKIDGGQFKKTNIGLYLSGPTETGKTYIAAAIGNEVANKGYSVAMYSYPDLSMRIKNELDAYSSKNIELIVSKMQAFDLLILDDFGTEMFGSTIRDAVLKKVLKYRVENKKPIIITSIIRLDRLQDTALRKDGSEQESIKAQWAQEKIKESMTEYKLSTKYEDKINKNRFSYEEY